MISVVIPIYNSEQYLHECVDSVLAQTYSDIEVILVDDGSTDASGTICDEYAAKDSRVKVIHQKNAKIAAARNAGIEASTGEYLTFIDSDDYIHPDAYREALTLMERYDADLVQWDLENVPGIGFEDGKGIENKAMPQPCEIVTDNLGAIRIMLDFHHQDERFNYIVQCCNCVWPKLFKRHLFDQIRFPIGKEYEDLRIVHRLYMAAERVVFTNRRFSYYRVRKDSTIHTMNAKGSLDGVEAYADKVIMLRDCSEEEVLLSMAAHNLLLSAMNAYPAVKGKPEEKQVKKILIDLLGNGHMLSTKGDKITYNVARTSLGMASFAVRLRRELRQGKERIDHDGR